MWLNFPYPPYAEPQKPGAAPYQTQINQALHQLIESQEHAKEDSIESLKQKLLEDREFIKRLASELHHLPTNR